ncbi:MarR family winged helix-turn-helix transcriptional regulator [Nocardia sp. NPDC127606]|uniref:MarR family winged helix-turn-helix transcriptional regulator n=1 Tax=Nocardia sp. NPDC127606 TaxID=3345406 RepID=UPI0036296AFE
MVISNSDNLMGVNGTSDDYVIGAQPGTGPRVTYLVKRLESAVRRDLDDGLRNYGLTTPQYAALSILGLHPGLSSAQLARRAFVTAQSMQVMVAGFVRSGYVVRQPQADNQRILCNYLTDAGRDALIKCEQAADTVEKKMLDGLDRKAVASLRDVFERCVRNLAEN